MPVKPGQPKIEEVRAEPAAQPPVPARPQPGASERRSFSMGELRIADGAKGLIEGHAAVFNSLSVPMWGFRERIKPGAFKKSIQESDIRALWNHDANYVLGRNKAGTLELSEDDKGLFVRIEAPNTQWADDLKESIRRGDINQMSFGFRTIKDDWHDEGGEVRRDLLECQLFDVSPVTFPAYEDTDVGVRAAVLATGGSVKLYKAVLRLNQGEALRTEEIDLIRQYADSLRSRLPAAEPVQTDHSEAAEKEPRQSPHSIATLRRRLDLLEAA